MKFTSKRLIAVAVVGAAGVLDPVASASAATVPTLPTGLNFPVPAYHLPALAFPTTGLPAFTPGGGGLSFVGPSVGGLSAVIGPTVITVGAGNIFTNTTITTTAGGAIVGAGTGG
jgi:hypothetical protein